MAILNGSAAINGIVTSTADSKVKIFASMVINGVATVSANSKVKIFASITVNGIATSTSDSKVKRFASSSITGNANVTAESKYTKIYAVAGVTGSAIVSCSGYKSIGTMTDAKTTIFYFESKLYFLNGTEYKQYDGTTFQDVDPYIPTVAIGTPPAGGGTPFDPINLLTGKKKQEFVSNGVATAYQLAETGLDASLVTCTVNGVTKAEGVDFTVNRTTGIVTFGVAPANGLVVILGWTKVESGNADLVKKNKYAMINGPGNDTAIFLWGIPAQKNRRSWSGTLKANYFPVTNFTLVGSNEFAITDIKPQYNRQIIFKEDKTHYSYAEWNITAGLWDYPVYDLNEKVGNIAFGAVQIVRNNPVSISGKSWWEWTSTSVEDERNADVVSERLRDSLALIDLSTAITFDNQREEEYWCCIGPKVYIWNYGNNTMYIYNNISGTCFLDMDGSIYYGSQGTIERFEGLDDNGVVITAQLITGFNDWGSMELVKNSKIVVVSFIPYSQTSLNVYYKTNKLNEFKMVNKVIEYRLLDFNDLNFDAFSFSTNRNPQAFRRKIRAKKYVYIQFMLENKSLNEPCVINSIKISAETQGETK
jgi:hypothetical protein